MTCYIVLGPPRSGTSLLSGVLHRSGVNMGDQFPGRNSDSNPTGFFEDVHFTGPNAKILSQCGASHLYPPKRERVAEKIEEWSKRTGDVIAARVHQPLWGWKDPRQILTWDVWAPHLANVDDVRLVIARRDVSAVIGSMMRLQWLGSEKDARRMVDEYGRRLEQILDEVDYPRVDVPFDDWWNDIDGQAARLTEFTGLGINAGLFDENLRHC